MPALAVERGEIAGHCGGAVPKVDAEKACALYEAMARATGAGLLRSSHTPTLGGLAVALALAAMGGNLGAEAELAAVPAEAGMTDDEILFSESNSRFVVTCAPENAEQLEALFIGLPFARIGRVAPEPQLKVKGLRGALALRGNLASLRKAFKKTLHGI